jgi:hypothetical protein
MASAQVVLRKGQRLELNNSVAGRTHQSLEVEEKHPASCQLMPASCPVCTVPTGLDHDCSDTVGRSGSTSTGPISPLPSIATHDGRCKGAVGPPPPLADQFGGLLRHVGLGFAWLDVAQCPFIASFRHKLKA